MEGMYSQNYNNQNGYGGEGSNEIQRQENQKPKKPKKKKKTDVVPTPEGYYSAKEIAEKHKISVKHVWVLTREHNIPKIAIRGFNYYEQPPIDELFRR